ncbi:hypothetical protein AGIG_G3146 [Arapaima gigas]
MLGEQKEYHLVIACQRSPALCCLWPWLELRKLLSGHQQSGWGQGCCLYAKYQMFWKGRSHENGPCVIESGFPSCHDNWHRWDAVEQMLDFAKGKSRCRLEKTYIFWNVQDPLVLILSETTCKDAMCPDLGPRQLCLIWLEKMEGKSAWLRLLNSDALFQISLQGTQAISEMHDKRMNASADVRLDML